MTGLIILLILIPVVIIILLAGIHSKTSSQQELLESLNEKIKQLNDRLMELSRNTSTDDKKVVIESKEPVIKNEPPAPIVEKVKVPEPQPVVIKAKEPVIEKRSVERRQEELAALEENLMTSASPKENKSDLEKYIGENLANKIGIAVLVLGISFFIKYAIDKDWVHEGGRVMIGLICGGILIGLAHRIRNRYRAFSSVLVGGGLTVFYFSVAFAFHQYHLISQQTAFMCMVIIAGLGVMLSLLYDRLELSVLATIGGFITPFLVNTGENNYIALFTYLSILNSGLMALAWFKRWPAINFIALFFTIIIYGGWLINGDWNDTQNIPYRYGLLFATIFYLQFITMSIIHNLRMQRTFRSFDFIVVLSINFLYYAAGMIILDLWNQAKYQGLFTASLAVFNFILLAGFNKKKSVDKNFILLLTGLTLSFISLFAPVQLKANYITLFWASEMVVLFWLYNHSELRLLKIASLFLTALTIISLLVNWSNVYLMKTNTIPIIINKGFITSVAVAIALFIYQLLVYRQAGSYYLATVTNVFVRNSFLSTSILVLYLAGILEIYYQFSSRFELPFHLIYLQLYTLVFALALLRIYNRSDQTVILRFASTIFCLVLYLISANDIIKLSFTLNNHPKPSFYFIGHWISAVLLLIMLYELIQLFRKNYLSWLTYQAHFSWLSAASIIVVLSIEAYHFLIWTNYSAGDHWEYAENLFYKAGLTILWSVCSFAMMWLGMKYHFRTLRIISLTLFTIILVKLFTYDIKNIPPGGKIAAFILLGVLLLVISFMYQRLKKIIIDDPAEEKNLAS